LSNARNFNLIADNYHNRTYSKPKELIKNLQNENHKIAASIQLFGGARVEAVTLIKYEQLKGTKIDSVINEEVGIIETKEPSKSDSIKKSIVHNEFGLGDILEETEKTISATFECGEKTILKSIGNYELK
jgi:hypothetical protein